MGWDDGGVVEGIVEGRGCDGRCDRWCGGGCVMEGYGGRCDGRCGRVCDGGSG